MSFRPNTSLAEQLAADPDVRAGLAEIAGQAADTARGLAPSGFTIEVVNDDDGVRIEMHGTRINPAGWVELGTSRAPAKAPLRQGCEAVGLELRGRRG